MKRIIYLVVALICATSINAQVRIGNNTEPHKGAVLDLKSTETETKGLLLPSVNLTDINAFLPVTGNKDEAAGMVVYNINETIGKGVYVWDGEKWSKIADSNGNGGDNSDKGTGDIGTSGSVPSISADGGSASLTLTTDCSVSGWQSITLSSANGAVLSNVNLSSGTFTVTFPAHTGSSSRTATVLVVDACGYSKSISVSQSGAVTVPSVRGTGFFTGKTCFDIAQSNNNTSSCAALGYRTGEMTDFSDATVQDPAGDNASLRPYSGTQVYTFTPSGTVSNVRFTVVDESGKVVNSFTPQADYTGNGISNPCKLTVVFKPSLVNDLKGLTREYALTAKIFVVYNDGGSNNGTDKMLELTLTLSDCSCCGAATTTGGWLTFMCHNLGADESLDPFTPDTGLYGDLYQWGRPTDGHEKRDSENTNVLATSNTPQHAKFITNSSSPYDWRSGGGNTTRWGDGTAGVNPKKADNDPCPSGWKVPSQSQWGSIYQGGTTAGHPDAAIASNWSWVSTGGGGFKVGSSLFLPAAGVRNGFTAALGNLGTYGFYWSSTVNTSNNHSYNLNFYSTSVNPALSNNRGSGMSVRCVADN